MQCMQYLYLHVAVAECLHAQGHKPQMTRLIMKVDSSVDEYKCMYKTDLYAFRIKALLVSETNSAVHAVEEELLLHRKGRRAGYAGIVLFLSYDVTVIQWIRSYHK